MVIRADGTWWHEGVRITRAPLVRLFSRILRKDDDGYVLVTPAEKVSIIVEDVPFLAVDFDIIGTDWHFRTNVGDIVRIDDTHPIEMRRSETIDQYAPYIRVRGGLDARLERSAYYRMAAQLETSDASDDLLLYSGGAVFTLQAEAAS